MNIPLYKPFVDKETVVSIKRVLSSRKLSRGLEVSGFEKKFAAYVGKKYAVSLNSGTSGLHVAVRAMKWGKGSEVITTSFSYVASANCLLFEGVTPIFVDIDPRTLNIDVEKIERAITPRTKGILMVHIFGFPLESQKIRTIARKYGLDVIEDACQAVGRSEKDFPVGMTGRLSVYGFHENKQLTTGGEGGMIVTNDKKLAEVCRSMRDQGRSRLVTSNWIDGVTLGFNFRMTEIQAAYGSAQLKSIDNQLIHRQLLAKEYNRILASVPELCLPFEKNNLKRSWFIYYVSFTDKQIREKVQKYLSLKGIATSTNYFPPIYRFPMYSRYGRCWCENAEKAASTILALPIFFEMTKSDVARVCGELKKALKHLK